MYVTKPCQGLLNRMITLVVYGSLFSFLFLSGKVNKAFLGLVVSACLQIKLNFFGSRSALDCMSCSK